MESQDVAATDHSMLQELMFDKQIFDGKPLLEQLRLASSLPSQSRVRQRITDNGWCPHLVNYHLSANRNWLKQEVDLDSKQMLETRSIESRDRHTVCRDSPFCKAYDVDKTTYRPKHVRPDCNCKHVSVPQQEIADIILSGNFPVLTVKSGHPEPSAVEKGGALEVVIEKGLSTWSTKSYVAVSHVWAQGLGNPIDNALPTCQLSALKRRLDALGTSRFWLDTLCMPVDPKYKRSYKATLHNMAAIYVMAQYVLVLDHDLMTTGELTTQTTLCQRIQRVAWAQRSWTLQEALLAHRWTFQLHGQNSLTMSQVLGITAIRKTQQHPSNLYRGWSNSLRQQFLRGFMARAWKARPSWYLPMTGKTQRNQLVIVWNLLAGRSTTYSEDLCLLIANLLDIHTDELADYDDSERMVRIMLRCTSLPFSIMCLSDHNQTEDLSDPNAWILRAPTRELINGDSGILILHPDERVWSLKVNRHSPLVCFRVSSAILTTKDCLIQTEQGETYVLKSLSKRQVGSDTPATPAYIILGDIVLGDDTHIRGACFLDRDDGDRSRRRPLLLDYVFPIRVRLPPSTPLSPGSLPTFELTRVYDTIDFRFSPVKGYLKPERNIYALVFKMTGRSIPLVLTVGLALFLGTFFNSLAGDTTIPKSFGGILAFLVFVWVALFYMLRRRYARRFKLSE